MEEKEKREIRTDRFISKEGELRKITSMDELSENEIKMLKKMGVYELAKKKMEQK